MKKITEAIENLEQVVETKDPIETVGTMDHVMADAYIQSEKVDKHIQEVTDELNKRAEAVILDPPANTAEKMPKSIYTENKLKLEEEFSDFVLKEDVSKEQPSLDNILNLVLEMNTRIDDIISHLKSQGYSDDQIDQWFKDRGILTEIEKVVNFMHEINQKSTISEDTAISKKDGRSHRQAARDENDGNKFLTYDMFTFIHELFAGQNCNTNPAPKTPIIYGKIVNRKTKEVTYGMRPMRKFMDSGVENRQVEVAARNFGVPQVSTHNGNIIISASQKDDLDDVIAACNIFEFKHSDPEPAASKYTYWPWRITVYVPMKSPKHPVMLEEYLSSINKTIEEVMFPEFATGYRKAMEKKQASMQKERQMCAEASARIQNYTASKESRVDTLLNDPKFNEIFNHAVSIAAGDDVPLEAHAKQLVLDLKNAGITFNRQIAMDLFMAEFHDEYPEEE